MIVAPLWIEHHQNVGTLARTCEAIGADLVIPSGFRREARKGNTCKYPPLYLERDDVERWVHAQVANPMREVIAVETGGDPIGSMSPSGDAVLLLGAEGQGIPGWAVEAADRVATLPQVGRAPCVNVAVAGSVAAYYFAGLIGGDCG